MRIDKGFKFEIIKHGFHLRFNTSCTYYTSPKRSLQIYKQHYLSRFAHFLSGCSSLWSGSVSITERSFSFRLSSILRAFSRSVFSRSSSSKAKGFSTSAFAVCSCSTVSVRFVFATSNFTGIFASSFSIRVRLPSASLPNSTLCFAFPQISALPYESVFQLHKAMQYQLPFVTVYI